MAAVAVEATWGCSNFGGVWVLTCKGILLFGALGVPLVVSEVRGYFVWVLTCKGYRTIWGIRGSAYGGGGGWGFGSWGSFSPC